MPIGDECSIIPAMSDCDSFEEKEEQYSLYELVCIIAAFTSESTEGCSCMSSASDTSTGTATDL